MSKGTLPDKIFERKTVDAKFATGKVLLFVDQDYIHEVTSGPAFQGLRDKGRRFAFPQLHFAAPDHVIATDESGRGCLPHKMQRMIDNLKRNCEEFGIEYFEQGSENHGILHIIGPELGLSRPGTVITVADSHTSTHGEYVAVGMNFAGRLAHERGDFPLSDLQRQNDLLMGLGFDLTIPSYISNEELMKYMAVDKKAAAGKINFTFPRGLGEMEEHGGKYKAPVPVEEIEDIMYKCRA